MTHLINKLQFEVTCPDEEQAFSLRHNFAITYQEQITEVIDKVCSKYVSDDEWLRIDKFVIDLGRFTPNALELNFNTVFKNKFEKELAEKLSQVSPIQKSISKQISKAELFQYFLINGYLPWWADEAQIDLNEISIELLADHPEPMLRFFYEHRFVPNVWRRAVYQLTSQAKALIISGIQELNDTKQLFTGWLNFLRPLVSSQINVEIIIAEDFIDNTLVKNALEIFKQSKNKIALLQIFKDGVAEIDLSHKSVIEEIIEEHKSALPQTDSFSFTNEEYHSSSQDNALSKTDLSGVIYSDIEKDLSQKLFIKHAGIILLTPFLKPFFTNLALINGAEWINKDAQYKAIHLLWFLSTGVQTAFEYNLILEKILCGVSIDEPVPMNITLEDKEVDEAEQLLSSVIEHWKAIKNTSVNGLREAFLKRDGLMKKQDNGWLLQVERKTLDVLVDSIPWGYSTISLPWNNYLISVEW